MQDPKISFSNLDGDFDDGPVTAGCAAVTYGPCVTTTCPKGVAPAHQNAGTITVTRAGAPFVSQAYSGHGYLATAPLIDAGDSFTIVAEGGTVPPFQATTPPTPTPVTLSAPVLPDAGTSLLLPTNGDVTFTWSGGIAGDVVRIQLVGSGTVQNYKTVCAFDASAGQGVVPRAAIAAFAGAWGGIWYGQLEPMSVDAGAWAVSIASGFWPYVATTFQ